MNFEFSQITKSWIERLEAFMQENIYPNEKSYLAEINGRSLAAARIDRGFERKGENRRTLEFVFAGRFGFDQSRIRAAGRADGQSLLVGGSF